MTLPRCGFTALFWLCACGDASPETDTGRDARADASTDASSEDATGDASDAARIDASGVDAQEVDAGPPLPPPGPRYVGRVDDSDPSAVRFGWPGTGVIVRFRGTAVRARLRDAGGFLTVVVDGEVAPRLALSGGTQTYALASGLTDGEHTVELYKRTEGFVGTCVLEAIEVDGELLGVPVPARSMEVVGDSITCGYGNEGADATCPFTADTENHYLTYAAIAARDVDAELSTIAWSGKGVVANYGDDTFEPMPTLYDRLIPTQAGDYSFERHADVVLINLGTNDFSTDGDPSAEEFTSAYVTFLAHIRERHPSALILGTIAPLLGGDDYARGFSYVEAAVATRVAAGDTLVRAVDLRVPSMGFGCDYHPSIATHQAMGELLSEVLSSELGW